MAILNFPASLPKMIAQTTWNFIVATACLKFSDAIQDSSFTCYRVIAFNNEERAILYKIQVKDDGVIFLNGVTNQAAMPMEVVVRRSRVLSFETTLKTFDIQYSYVNHKLLPDGNPDDMRPGCGFANNIRFPDWNTLNDIVDERITKYRKMLKKTKIASTYEKRDLYILQLSTGVRRSGVFIMGGEEGKDCLSPSIIINFIDKLINNKNISNLLDWYDFYFVPVFNPDGYDYSANVDPLWTQNRKQFPVKIMCDDNITAIGVTIDKNWYLSNSASYDPKAECDSVFLGRKSLSEEESHAFHVVLNRLSIKLMAFISLRSFEKLITIPYAYTKIPSNNHALMMEIGSSVCQKLKYIYNHTYFFGTTASYKCNGSPVATKWIHGPYKTTHCTLKLSPASKHLHLLTDNYSGLSSDWVKEKLNIPIVYTISMEYKDTFFPEVEHIEPLTQQLVTILNDTLTIARDIYGPLYNVGTQCNTLRYGLSIQIVVTILLLPIF